MPMLVMMHKEVSMAFMNVIIGFDSFSTFFFLIKLCAIDHRVLYVWSIKFFS